MSFEINDYKLKHIISLKEGLIDNTPIEIPIENKEYTFKIDAVKTEIIELIDFFQYQEVKLAMGPLEQKLKDFTYGKSYSELSEHELYEIRFSKFKSTIENKTYEFEITGAGPKALKVSLFLRYDLIEKEETSLETKLKRLILTEYEDIINDRKYQEKLKELKKEDEKKEEEREKIREEVKREQEEKERKRRELEELLNSNKPKNNERPFKMY